MICPRCKGAATLPIHTSAGPPPPCYVCGQTGRVEGPPVWKLSGYDGQVHAVFGAGTTAVCTHSAPPKNWTTVVGDAGPCFHCVMVVGEALPDEARWHG